MSAPDWEGFGRAVMDEWQDHYDIEASEKFDLAVRYGVLVKIPGGYDPETHVDNYGGAEKGEPWYQIAPEPDT